MTAPSSPSKATTCRPAVGVPLPLKVGKSLLRPRNRQARHSSSTSPASAATTREFLALKFTHVPDSTLTSSRGQLTREDNTIAVELATKEAGETQLFTGQRRKSREEAASSDFVLVFVNGAFWLERVTDYANCLRPGEVNFDGKFNPDDTASASIDDIAADPDSWMPGADLESASPITPEDDMVADDASGGTGVGGANLPHPHGASSGAASVGRNGFAGKGVPGPSLNLMGLGGGGTNMNGGSRQEVRPSPGMVGSKSLAAKTLAVKSVANVNGPASRRRPDTLEDDFSDAEVEVEIDEGGENDGEGDVGNDGTNDKNNSDDDRLSKSSSSDDDSEDSDSDSDSDSPDYTTESSDE